MNYDEAKAILKELYKDRPDLIVSYNEDLGGEVTSIMLEKIEPVEPKTFLQEQFRLADKR